MTPEIAIVLGLLAVAMVLFVTEWLSVDIVALLLIVALVGTGILTPAEAFGGFGDEVIIVLAAIMVLAGAVVKAGVMDGLGQLAHRVAGQNQRLSILTILGVCAGSSAFLSNTNTTAILMPAAVETARQAKVSPSRVLMPLAYASMLGGACTLIGTSANLASSGLIARLGLEPFSIFEFAGVGGVIALAGLLWVVGPGSYLFPEHRAVETRSAQDTRHFFTTLCLPEGSAAIGKPLHDVDLEALDADLLAIVRGSERLGPHPSRKLREGDELIVRASKDGFLKLWKSKDFALEPDIHFSDRHGEAVAPVTFEAVVTPQSGLVGRTLKQIGFFDRYRSIVLAVYQRDRTVPVRIENLRLRAGDLFLLQASEDDLAALHGDPDLRALSEVDKVALTRRDGITTLVAMVAAVTLGALGLVPLSIAFLSAVLVVVLAGVISMSQAYRFIEWRLLVLIAGMSSFGAAMERSGAADFLADYIVAVGAPLGPTAAMAGFSLITILLTQPMSNAAAALTVIPVAVAAAEGLDLDPRMLAILVTLSASLSFISPLEPACLLVYDAGRYRFRDYIRAGIPLTLLCVVLLLILVPWIWS
ncbi:SLC13 family permease [Sedimentimonas flavescens]|uniref:SLC13 family permease n=1 Tax=Sedimentimonas flavescens TaxID=2851012 RepID=UPI0021A61C0B|nr:SLC13 family permease [Sedimentimonas flavescens]MCT2538961.1 SLC13 family permease [Sedimentimonas flavescens]WBL32214.1 SLC13 family permease [Sinirhodobacter sp. HNIBRBA609]